jgi:hypothetical protein
MRLRERTRSEVGGREFALGNVAIMKWLDRDKGPGSEYVPDQPFSIAATSRGPLLLVSYFASRHDERCRKHCPSSSRCKRNVVNWDGSWISTLGSPRAPDWIGCSPRSKWIHGPRLPSAVPGANTDPFPAFSRRGTRHKTCAKSFFADPAQGSLDPHKSVRQPRLLLSACSLLCVVVPAPGVVCVS